MICKKAKEMIKKIEKRNNDFEEEIHCFMIGVCPKCGSDDVGRIGNGFSVVCNDCNYSTEKWKNINNKWEIMYGRIIGETK